MQTHVATGQRDHALAGGCPAGAAHGPTRRLVTSAGRALIASISRHLLRMACCRPAEDGGGGAAGGQERGAARQGERQPGESGREVDKPGGGGGLVQPAGSQIGRMDGG